MRGERTLLVALRMQEEEPSHPCRLLPAYSSKAIFSGCYILIWAESFYAVDVRMRHNVSYVQNVVLHC